MKPPSRRRTEPSRFSLKCTEEKPTGSEKRTTVRSFCKGWTRKEQRSLLQALKRQKNCGSELDPTELQKVVPRRSLQEVEDLIKLLKSSVVQMVFQQVHSQLREERRNRVPIEIWGDLVQKVTRSHEKTISSAFSQMLVIAATEPCSLLNSIPPQAIDFPKPTRPSQKSKPTAQLFPSVPSTNPVVTVLPTQIDNTAQPSSSDTSSIGSASTSSAGFSLIQPACSSNAVERHAKKSQPSSLPQESSTSKEESSHVMISQSQLKSEPEAVAYSLSAMSIDSASPSVSIPFNQDNPSQSQMLDQDSEQRPRVLKCIVNFDKIYEYLSDPETKTCSSALTSMEYAVLLDLLMSLPEELPLLDCDQLQHHLLQVHGQLTKPVQNPASSLKSSKNISPATVDDSAKLTNQEKTTPESYCPSEEPSDDSSVTEPAKEKDWDSVGMRPLNPLMIPIDLLKRRSVESGNDTSSLS
ncbi:snRNA-activating protein complex subunit 2 [Triplophysa dalaica]|uniref:snRNA-activating protein complex subunit 2 n=1 Tax=Triplophysa dalaica TaxID=1582913 RepID=UPI0024E0115B|nr:snRNA-activating protein complex subunit 2 [Triplophysa dalaica]XP_056605481.1 snRNA-activating protein complex subunit 2 [Triplophysa dalaica]XP_056605482.1 snRNA-activating protein complex subunit 2 [Triplophysa dalaica]XP_056605483.1 snRNA-activating protein complex subunit 2 [Triplophysa dalaica]XP_056605484.1 snRNA-activating protein complex subunit 2 [Triplophysa dalaica]